VTAIDVRHGVWQKPPSGHRCRCTSLPGAWRRAAACPAANGDEELSAIDVTARNHEQNGLIAQLVELRTFNP
jgi:hypothetical protein